METCSAPGCGWGASIPWGDDWYCVTHNPAHPANGGHTPPAGKADREPDAAAIAAAADRAVAAATSVIDADRRERIRQGDAAGVVADLRIAMARRAREHGVS